MQEAGIQWETDFERGIYRENIFSLLMEVQNAHHAYESMVIEVSLKPPLRPEYLSSKQKKMKMVFTSKSDFNKDQEILEDLKSDIGNLQVAMIIGFEQERWYRPFAVNMDARPPKRRANDNGNLDSLYGFHIDKKLRSLPTLKGLDEVSVSSSSIWMN